MDFRKLNPSLNTGGKANWRHYDFSIKNEIERMVKIYTLDELVEGAREYDEFDKTSKAEIEAIETRQKELREQIGELEARANKLRRDRGECSFGRLLTRAIGTKITQQDK